MHLLLAIALPGALLLPFLLPAFFARTETSPEKADTRYLTESGHHAYYDRKLLRRLAKEEKSIHQNH